MYNVNICFNILPDYNSASDSVLLERQYSNCLKNIVSFLYKQPKFPVSIGFTGPQVEHYSKKHPECLTVFKELSSRKQVEIIGGGFYSPIFPILFPVDRSGQIEKQTSILRTKIGKRPRGINLYGNFWDPVLITTFCTCGMDYAFLDNYLIPEKVSSILPIITGEQGKTLKVIPLFKDLKPTQEELYTDWIKRLNSFIRSQIKYLNSFENDELLITIPFFLDEFVDFMSTNVFENLIESFEQKQINSLKLTTPQKYLKDATRYVRSYIPAGMEKSIANWATTFYENKDNKTHFPLTIYDYLNTYNLNRMLYDRMMYVSMLISQCKGGDKIRKSNASETLWKAQCGSNYVTIPNGTPSLAKSRQQAYKELNEAERIIRDANKNYKNFLLSFDYNEDGINEYVCHMERYDCVIDLHSAQLCELDVIKSGTNYASSLSRIEKFDGVNDNYHRGIFVEHLFEPLEFENYLKDNLTEGKTFSNCLFKERKFDSKRQEIYLDTIGTFSALNLPVCLRKNFVISQSSVTVQYIIKNDSPIALKGIFASEINLNESIYNLKNNNDKQYKTELILNDTKLALEEDKYNSKKGVSFIQITDAKDKISFSIEPNEESGFCCNSISFKRPDCNGEVVEAAKTNVYTLYWDVDIPAGMEMEKTITLSIVPVRRQTVQQ